MSLGKLLIMKRNEMPLRYLVVIIPVRIFSHVTRRRRALPRPSAGGRTIDRASRKLWRPKRDHTTRRMSAATMVLLRRALCSRKMRRSSSASWRSHQHTQHRVYHTHLLVWSEEAAVSIPVAHGPPGHTVAWRPRWHSTTALSISTHRPKYTCAARG